MMGAAERDSAQEEESSVTTEPKQTRPPPTNDRLYDYFSCEGLTRPSSHESFVHMASVGVATGSGMPDGDGKLVRSGAVGVRGERSKAQRYRETDALMAHLDPFHVRILRLAYGPQDQVPALKLSFDPEARARIDGVVKAGADKAQRERQLRDRLGSWRQVMPETPTAKRVAPHGMSPAAYLAKCHDKDVLSAARVEAHRLVVDAWCAWQALQPKRLRPAQRLAEPYGGAW